MKKSLIALVLLMVVLSSTACGNGRRLEKTPPTPTVNQTTQEKDKEPVEEPEKDNDKTTESVAWKEFLKDYETWVDKYIDITKKYKENPSDISLLTDYTKMIEELAEWSTKTEDVEKELKNASPSELTKYTAELARIVSKLAQVTY